MKKLAALFLILVTSAAFTQQMSHRMTNKDVIDMVALGLSDDVIITKIHSAARPEDLAFDTSVEGLKELKAGKVSDAVIRIMISPASAAPVAVPTTGGAHLSPTSQRPIRTCPRRKWVSTGKTATPSCVWRARS